MPAGMTTSRLMSVVASVSCPLSTAADTEAIEAGPGAPGQATGRRRSSRQARGPASAAPPCCRRPSGASRGSAIAVFSSSTCSVMNHCRKIWVAWSCSAPALRYSCSISEVTSCSCASTCSNSLVGEPKSRGGCAQRLERHPAVAVQDEVVELHRVLALLVGLEPHPVREAWQVLAVAVRRHRQVQVRRVELLLELLVEGIRE